MAKHKVQHLDPDFAPKKPVNPLYQLEKYMLSKQGIDEAKPFGIEKSAAM